MPASWPCTIPRRRCSTREVLLYKLWATAAATDPRSGFQIGLLADDWRVLTTPGSHELSGPTGDSSVGVSVSVGDELYASNGGAVTIASFEAGRIAGTVDATVVPARYEGDEVPVTASFQGAIGSACRLYMFEGDQAGEFLDLGLDDPRCAVLFE
jgi:hypothetical protein